MDAIGNSQEFNVSGDTVSNTPSSKAEDAAPNISNDGRFDDPDEGSKRPSREMCPEDSSLALCFARLVPFNEEAMIEFSAICDAMQAQPNQHQHHRQYMVIADRQTPFQPSSQHSSFVSTADTDPDADQNAGSKMIWTGHYALSLDCVPEFPLVGWRAGKGRRWNKDETGDVDLLLSLRSWKNLHGNHASFTFDRDTGILCLAPNYTMILGATKVGGNMTMALNQAPTIIQFGSLQYKFEYTVAPEDEEEHQKEKTNCFKLYLVAAPPHPLTPATPSNTDTTIGQWTLQGAAGRTRNDLIRAASHIDGTTAAFKKLDFQSEEKAAKSLKEVRLYQDITRRMRNESNGRFVMQFREFVNAEPVYEYGNKPRDTYLVWTPLARFDWGKLVNDFTDRRTVLALLKQIMQGISAVHRLQYVHRDLKLQNLGVVSLEPTPQAVILDLGQAARSCAFYPRSGLYPDC
ncbi:hypothetical protein LTR66_013912 [Elasticomyces elasticus]|nr:hypothetical protein LTR66_013912 [Elasticomyces elasticus]